MVMLAAAVGMLVGLDLLLVGGWMLLVQARRRRCGCPDCVPGGRRSDWRAWERELR